MNRKAAIGAELKLDKRGFSQTLNSAIAEGKRGANELGSIKSAGGFDRMRNGIERVGKAYGGLRSIIGDVVSLAKGPVISRTDFADYRDMLTAVEGDAISAGESLAFLTSISNNQAMEIEPLVQAHARLVSLGYSAERSRDMIRELANAAEFSGEGVDSVTAIVGALEKIDEKGEASVKQLMQFGDALPVLRNILDLQFGTKTAADLAKLDLSGAQVFDGLLAGLKSVDTATASTEEQLVAAESMLKNKIGAAGNFTPAELPNRTPFSESEDQRAQRIAAMQKEAADTRQAAAAALFQSEQKLSELELNVATAEASGDSAALLAAEKKLALAKDLAKVMAETGADEALATAHIEKQVESARQLQEVTESADRKKSQAATLEDLEVAKLRSRGKNKQADKKEAEITQTRREAELKSQGFTKDEAAMIAGSEREIADDNKHFSETGRRRIKGAKTKDSKSGGGLDQAFKDSALNNDTFVIDDTPRQPMNKPESGQKPGDTRFKPRAPFGTNDTKSQDIQKIENEKRSDLSALLAEMKAVRAAIERQNPSPAQNLKPT